MTVFSCGMRGDNIVESTHALYNQKQKGNRQLSYLQEKLDEIEPIEFPIALSK